MLQLKSLEATWGRGTCIYIYIYIYMYIYVYIWRIHAKHIITPMHVYIYMTHTCKTYNYTYADATTHKCRSDVRSWNTPSGSVVSWVLLPRSLHTYIHTYKYTYIGAATHSWVLLPGAGAYSVEAGISYVCMYVCMHGSVMSWVSGWLRRRTHLLDWHIICMYIRTYVCICTCMAYHQTHVSHLNSAIRM